MSLRYALVSAHAIPYDFKLYSSHLFLSLVMFGVFGVALLTSIAVASQAARKVKNLTEQLSRAEVRK